MNTPKKSVRQAVAERSVQREAACMDHPSTADLAAYLDNLLSQEETEAMREHLAFCRKCNDEITVLDQPLAFEVDPDAIAPRAALAGQEATSSGRQIPAWLAMAAVIFLAGILVGRLMVHEGGSMNQLPLDLSPEANIATRGLVEKTIPPFVERLGINLNIAMAKSYAAYSLVIRDGAGREIRRVRSLRPLPGGYFNISLPVSLFATGTYSFQLFGILADGGLEPLATYHLSLTREI